MVQIVQIVYLHYLILFPLFICTFPALQVYLFKEIKFLNIAQKLVGFRSVGKLLEVRADEGVDQEGEFRSGREHATNWALRVCAN